VSQPPLSDPYRLSRFLDAQDRANTYQDALSDLRRGHKSGHWMWFVFPQIAGLGRSATSREFAISSLSEAQAYLRHPVLGSRLIECAQAVAAVTGRSAAQIFGAVDAQKLHSSMTLFAYAAPDIPIFREVLARYFDGAQDDATRQRL
jgi:uncharacterized protein (DUF1810 family)